MMFSKDHSNSGGQSLCETCLFLHNGTKSPNGFVGFCALSKDFVIDCGVCSKYTERNYENGK